MNLGELKDESSYLGVPNSPCFFFFGGGGGECIWSYDSNFVRATTLHLADFFSIFGVVGCWLQLPNKCHEPLAPKCNVKRLRALKMESLSCAWFPQAV